MDAFSLGGKRDIGPIWTIDGRDSVFLDVVADFFETDARGVGQMIAASHIGLKRALLANEIDYQQLRSCLTPQRDRLETAFFFRTDGLYSRFEEARLAVLGILPKASKTSIHSGEVPARGRSVRPINFPRGRVRGGTGGEVRPLDTYVIYLNNLSATTEKSLQDGLGRFDWYVGSVDLTFSDPIKTWVSSFVTQQYLKCGQQFLCINDDLQIEAGRNVPGWPLPKGTECVAVSDTDYFTFLSYKIERMPEPHESNDVLFSLAAVSSSPSVLRDFEVTIDERKKAYLDVAKKGMMEASGLLDLPSDRVAALIGERMGRSYIYNLRFSSSLNQTMFNVCIEVPRPDRPGVLKMMAALEYMPEPASLRLVTFF